jgi:hypothetical protein
MKPLTDDVILALRQEAVGKLEALQPAFAMAKELHDMFMKLYAQAAPGWDEDPTKQRQLWSDLMNKQNEIHCSLSHVQRVLQEQASITHWERQREGFGSQHQLGDACTPSGLMNAVKP